MATDRPKLWGATDAYERYMGRWSHRIAPMFLDWIGAQPGKSWADLGCGTGELSAQIAETCAPQLLHGVDTSQPFVEFAANRVASGTFTVGDATETELTASTFDYAVSALVLNFIPEKDQALREMARIVRPGGTVGLYVWDYAGHMQNMRYFFDVARDIDPSSTAFDDGQNAPICRPGPLTDALKGAGLNDVEITALDITTEFRDFDDYWEPFLGGTGSAPKYCMSVDDDTRNRIKDTLRKRLPTGPDGEILIAARAWAAKGTVA